MSKFRIENRYQDSGWEDSDEAFDLELDALVRAREMASEAMIYGMVRVIAPDGRVVVELGAGDGNRPMDQQFIEHLKQASQVVSSWSPEIQSLLGGAPQPYISLNDAEPDSLVYEAEQWMLRQGLNVPLAGKFPHLFQGMLDDFQETADYDEWESSES